MATLNECRSRLQSIINDLRDIEGGIRHDFVGIGQDLCSNCIGKVASKYEIVLTMLNNVNQNIVAEWINGGN